MNKPAKVNMIFSRRHSLLLVGLALPAFAAAQKTKLRMMRQRPQRQDVLTEHI